MAHLLLVGGPEVDDGRNGLPRVGDVVEIAPQITVLLQGLRIKIAMYDVNCVDNVMRRRNEAKKQKKREKITAHLVNSRCDVIDDVGGPRTGVDDGPARGVEGRRDFGIGDVIIFGVLIASVHLQRINAPVSHQLQICDILVRMCHIEPRVPSTGQRTNICVKRGEERKREKKRRERGEKDKKRATKQQPHMKNYKKTKKKDRRK